MKRLYLVRHAKSSWKYNDLTDFERPLNGRGKRNAPFMGSRLNHYKVRPDLMISSPAARAHTTAKIIANEIDYPIEKIVTEKLLYIAGVSTILSVINSIDNVNNDVMLFGHNPGFTSLAEYLADYQIDNIPTCGIFCIEFEADSWLEISGGLGSLIFFDYPKKHQISND